MVKNEGLSTIRIFSHNGTDVCENSFESISKVKKKRIDISP
jgi:hypothetical protein